MHALYAIFGILNMETPAEVSRNLCARLCEHRHVWDTDFDIGFQSHRAQKRWTTVNAKEGAEACVEEGPDRLHKCPGLQLNYSETCYQLHDCEGRRRLLSNTMLGATFKFWIIAPFGFSSKSDVSECLYKLLQSPPEEKHAFTRLLHWCQWDQW